MPYADPEMARQSARRRYLANRAARIAKATQRNRENPEQHAAACARWRETHPEAARAKWNARTAAWLERNPDGHREANRRYLATARGQQVNADKSARRRAAKAHEGAELIRRDEVLRRSGGVCGLCHELIEGEFHIDHIVPLARGGEHTYANVQAAHPACNLRKGASDSGPR